MLFGAKPRRTRRTQRGEVLVQIFLNTNRPAHGYEPHHVLRLVRTYQEPVPGVAALGSAVDSFDEALLGRVFLLLNGLQSDRRAREYFAAGNRSLSVGDVIAIDGRCYACTDTAWQALTTPVHTLMPQPNSSVRR